MCGIAGFWTADAPREPLEGVARGMADALRHRGPDAGGEWADADHGVGLGHRRLSIIDLSPLGRQPMVSASARWVTVYNGEVYNFAELRRELEALGGPAFRGHSDTEVILRAVEAWGVHAAVRRFVGMFALALWDRQERTLHLVRDRLGIKPLYYGWQGRALVFGSELKALEAYPGFAPELDRGAVAAFLRYGYVPAPACIWSGVRKLLPGTILSLRSATDRGAEPVPFWSAREVAERGLADPFRGSDEEAVEAADGLLRQAVGLRMVADVPLGAFLSGGVDSSTVVALMQAQSARPVKTFSIGFHERAYDEARHAAAVAAHLGTEHTELYVTPAEAMDVIPRLPEMYDEPFADSSQIPTHLVSVLARREVTVSLSGDGGDELFGGYNRHVVAAGLGRTLRRVPRPLRAGAAGALRALSPAAWDRAFALARPVLGRRADYRQPGYKVHKLAQVLGAASDEALYRGLVSQWDDAEALVPGAAEARPLMADAARLPRVPGLAERMMYLDLVTYLPDDILAKVDRASMAVGLEARVPLLDHRVVEFAWRLPLHMKLRDGRGKWLLRRVLDRYVPASLMERPKSGFGIPLDQWLRGPLRGWAEELLSPARLAAEGIIEPGPVAERWRRHRSGARDWQYSLWHVLMFQAWHERHRQARSARVAA